MEKVSSNLDNKPETRTVKVKDCQLAGGTMHQWLNSIGQKNKMPWGTYLDQHPDDAKAPLMKAMVAMDKQLQDKLHPLIELKQNNEKEVKLLISKYAHTIQVEEGGQKPPVYSFAPDKFSEYSVKLKELAYKYDLDMVAFGETEIEITPCYATRLPDFQSFPDEEYIRNPLKGFVIPL